MRNFLPLVAVAAFVSAAAVRAEMPEKTAPSDWYNRLRVGATVTPLVRLHDDSRTPENSFLGTITELKVVSPSLPVRPYVEYAALPWFHVRLSYESLATRTGTIEGDTDGDFRFGGPGLSLRARYPNESRWTPAAMIGVIWYSADFDEDGRWGNGFPGTPAGKQAYREWLAAGSPPWPNGGYQRRLDPESQMVGFELGASVEYALDERWRIEAFARRVQAEVRAHYTLRVYDAVREDRGWHNFPHSHTAFGLGVSYRF